jgi:hypothetical protein
MNLGTHRVRRRRGSAARIGTALLAATTMVLLSACSGHESAAGSGPNASASPASAVAFSRCMRSHGLERFPDPESDGQLAKVTPGQLGVSAAAYRTAHDACAHLLQPSTSQAQQTLTGLRDFARCMRSRGVNGWPDPTLDDNGDPVFDLHEQVNPGLPPASNTADTCTSLLRPPPGQEGVVLCNGIGEDGCHHYGRPGG